MINRCVLLYVKLLRPWLNVIVYLWILELFACFAINDPEPLFDRIADCSAILATLVFWICIGGLIPWLFALGRQRAAVVSISSFAASGSLILITALYFIRWLLTWARLLGNPNSVPYVLAVVGMLIGIWVWRRWKNQTQAALSIFSSSNGWAYFTSAILVVAVMSLGLKMASSLWSRKINHAVSSLSLQHRPNVVVLVADALRAQNMSLYGYARRTTPFLDRFADRANVYNQMHTNSTSTRTSLTTILSGKHPFSHGRLTKFLPSYDSPEQLVAVLRDNGYTTAAITSNSDATFYSLGLVKYLVHGEYPNFRRLTLSFLRDNGVYPTNPGNRMYDELAQLFFFLGFPDKTLGYGPAGATIDLAIRTLERLPEPFFLFVHLHEPHDPYEVPAPFRGKYSRMPYRQVHEKIASYYYRRYKSELQPFVDALRDYYDEAIEYMDWEVERFSAFLDRNPKTRNAIFLFVGDHGESFERGFLNHGEDLYESSTRVPLVIKFPNQRNGKRVAEPAQSADIAPTILDTLGIPLPPWMDGVSLARHGPEPAREIVTVNFKDPAEQKVYDRPTKVAIIRQQLKLIVSCDTERAELYDVSRDPWEQKDLSFLEPPIVTELWRKLEEYLAMQKGVARMTCSLWP